MYKLSNPLCVALGLLLWLSPAQATQHNQHSALGINTNEVFDDDASAPFVDLFKSAMPFEDARPWYTKGKVEYDKDGWPTKLNGGQVGTRFMHKVPQALFPEGIYTVRYDGKGEIEYGHDAKLVKRLPGRDMVEIKAGKDKEFLATLQIKKIDESTPIRNIRILMPGGVCSSNPYRTVKNKNYCRGSKYLSFADHYKTIIFNPAFLNYMKDFKVLRFMNMAGITRNPISRWEDRNLPSKHTWGGKEGFRGVPLEIMVELVNRLDADPWFSIPHRANNDFVRRFAQYVKAKLEPGRKVYVEYTNEAWNPIFNQAIYMKDMGEKLGLDDDRDKAGYKFFSKRSVEVFKIFAQGMGGKERMVTVMGGWTGYTRLTEMLLDYEDAYKHTDAYAIAPYFFVGEKKMKKVRSMSQLYRELYNPKERYSLPKVLEYIAKHARITKKFGVDLIAYEGGQHLVQWKAKDVKKHPTSLYIKANKDWRMARAYKQFLAGWKKAGGKTFVLFSAPRSYHRFGSWGTKEHVNQPIAKAPKHRAILSFSKANRCWWTGCTAATVARHSKPSKSPSEGVYALVPSRSKSTKLAALGKAARKARELAKANAGQKVVAAASSPATTTAASVAVASTATAAKVAKNAAENAAEASSTVVSNPAAEGFSKVSVTAPAAKTDGINAAASAVTSSDGKVSRAKPGGQLWNPATRMRLSNRVGGNVDDANDLSATVETHWDTTHLHVRVDVKDDKFIKDSSVPWRDDSIELFIDADNSRSARYDGKNDYHIIYRWKDRKVNISRISAKRSSEMGIRKTMRKVRGGYILFTSIPWRSLGVKPKAGSKIGLNVHVNDDDNGRDKDAKISWHGSSEDAWHNPRSFGQLVLAE